MGIQCAQSKRERGNSFTSVDTLSSTLNNHQRRAAQYKKIGEALTALDIEWRIRRGESPNPWGVDKSDNFDTQQIITRHKLSRLERKTLEMDEDE